MKTSQTELTYISHDKELPAFQKTIEHVPSKKLQSLMIRAFIWMQSTRGKVEEMVIDAPFDEQPDTVFERFLGVQVVEGRCQIYFNHGKKGNKVWHNQYFVNTSFFQNWIKNLASEEDKETWKKR